MGYEYKGVGNGLKVKNMACSDLEMLEKHQNILIPTIP